MGGGRVEDGSSTLQTWPVSIQGAAEQKLWPHKPNVKRQKVADVKSEEERGPNQLI